MSAPPRHVARHRPNTSGRDFVVGDIHGAFTLLRQALARARFNPATDRLFSVGDLVDRGVESPAAAEWIDKPWFHAVLGNHDAQYAFMKGGPISEDISCNGVERWWLSMPEQRFEALCQALARLPFAIEVESAEGLIVLVHAGVPLDYPDWGSFAQALRDGHEGALIAALWDRESAQWAQDVTDGPERGIEPGYWLHDIAHAFHGHTPDTRNAYRPYRLSNRYYIDTGACFAHKRPGATLSLFDLTNPAEPLIALRPDTPTPRENDGSLSRALP
ncbi:serine/threonine protein phosphatase 1 [Natronocella acetinitrilica]|uniref:Serine/threonine protein phosphatase 1 n=1 Tax=Natronocella acetinitrilica TaxID=414046 RepID=A0AAE3G576_9GAMM|nr:serine/threonine protein phosphatase 1 [Natronocella acetinitrilica]